MNQYPFHYEVNFKLLAFDEFNNVKNQIFTIEFKDKPPLINRKEAFEEFEEYLTFMKKQGRLKLNRQGNYYINQPGFITSELDKASSYNNPVILDKKFQYFKEEITVKLVVTDHSIATSGVIYAVASDELIQEKFDIHKVASFQFDQQDIVDNLEMTELALYNHFKIDVGELRTIVYHYDWDYWDTGEDIKGGAQRTILKTPHQWSTLEDYHEKFSFSTNHDSPETIDDNKDLIKIIQQGESNQIEFKSSLVYNFKTCKGGMGIKYIIAKAICGFLNSNGGVIFVGVRDNGEIQGLEDGDYKLFDDKKKKDKMMLELDSLIANFFDLIVKPLISSSIESAKGKDILIIMIHESHKPIFLKNKKDDMITKEMYVRMNASTRQIIDCEEIIGYVFSKKWKSNVD